MSAQRKIDSAGAAELYLAGMSLEQVAKVTGFTRGGVQLRLKRAGVAMRRRGPQPTAAIDVELVARLRAEALAERAAAAQMEFEEEAAARLRSEAVAAALERVRVKTAAARAARAELRAECRAAAEAGGRGWAIEKAAGVPRSTVHRWIADPS